MTGHCRMIALAFFAIAAPSVVANAQPSTVREAVSGMDVARVIASETSQIASIEAMLTVFLDELIKTSPEISVLVESYPGVDKVWTDTMRPILQDEIRQYLPEYQAKLAALFEANMSAAQRNEMVRFYSSPTGQMVISGVSDSQSNKAVAKDLAEQVDRDPSGQADVNISTEALTADRKAVAQNLRRNATDQQKRDIARFELSPTGRKLAQILPQKQVIDLEWANRQPSASATERIEREISAAIQSYIAKVDAENAARTAG